MNLFQGLSGEGALADVLSSVDNRSLLKIAKSRGIDVSREAQLKPGVANAPIVKKIVDDMSPDEVQNIRDTYLEVSRVNSQPWRGLSPEAWHTLVLEQYFGDVKIPNTQLMRLQKELDQIRTQGMR